MTSTKHWMVGGAIAATALAVVGRATWSAEARYTRQQDALRSSIPHEEQSSTPQQGGARVAGTPSNYDRDIIESAARMLKEGKDTFRYDTFGSEDFWGGQLRLHEALSGEQLGGVGKGVSPKAALAIGLKVDAEAIPADLAAEMKAGRVDLDDPKTTAELLKLNAVIGVKGIFDGDKLSSVGISCALCHSTVDDSFMPGVGKRLDGWCNRDLDVGSLVAMAPNLQPFVDLLGVDEGTVKKVLTSWGPGRYDAELDVDGKGVRPDGKPGATMIPSAFGLAGVNLHTWTGGWGTATYWNAYVANTQMHGKGVFFDPRLDDAERYPIAAKAKFGHKRDDVDLITPKLAALHFYQLAMPTPKAPEGSYNTEMAERGKAVFNDLSAKGARCAQCHVPPLFTEPGHNLHSGAEIGIDDFQANRGPARSYVTTPLRALWNTEKLHKGGFYHDGRFATLEEVVDHYTEHLKLNLSDKNRADLIEYLKSI